MKTVKYILMTLIIFSSNLLFAGTSSEGIIRGRILSFDSKTVTLLGIDNIKKKVPRSAIPKAYTIKEDANVVAYVELDKKKIK